MTFLATWGGLKDMNDSIGSTLKLEGLTMKFGGLTAVNDLSLEVPKGSIVGLIGPNGAGKTTVFNVITGFYQPTAGKILFREWIYLANNPMRCVLRNRTYFSKHQVVCQRDGASKRDGSLQRKDARKVVGAAVIAALHP